MKTCAALGDSQTQPYGWGAEPWRAWGPLLDRALGDEWIVRTFGVGGDTTAQLLARLGAAFRYDTPAMAAVYIGVNDPAASIVQATTQLNIEASIMALKHGARGNGLDYAVSVADVASLPATGEPGQRYVVLADASTTGGQTAVVNAGQAATITGAATGPTVWEYRYPRAGEYGWGRVAVRATAPTVVKQIVVVSTNYLNYTTGGDTLTTPYSAYASIRTAQQAAVTAQAVTVGGKPAVVYADLYAAQKARIQSGADPDFSSVAYDAAQSWHATQNNQHHNAYGHQLVEQTVRAAITTAGWDLAA